MQEMQKMQDIKVYDAGNADYYRYTIVFTNKTFGINNYNEMMIIHSGGYGNFSLFTEGLDGSPHLGSLIDFESLPNSVRLYALNVIRNAGIHISANDDLHNM